MPGTVIGKSLPLGYPGTFSRLADCSVANRIAKTVIPFGAPVALNADNTYSMFGADNTAEDFAGVAVREVKQQTDIYQASGEYLPGEPCDALLHGSAIIRVNGKPAAAGGAVYVRIAENAAMPGFKVGDFEAAADDDKTVKLNNVKFTTGQWDNGLAEVTVLTRQI